MGEELLLQYWAGIVNISDLMVRLKTRSTLCSGKLLPPFGDLLVLHNSNQLRRFISDIFFKWLEILSKQII